jgi:hypothetical protein
MSTSKNKFIFTKTIHSEECVYLKFVKYLHNFTIYNTEPWYTHTLNLKISKKIVGKTTLMYATYALYTQFFTNHPDTLLVTFLKCHSVLRELCCCYVMNGPRHTYDTCKDV